MLNLKALIAEQSERCKRRGDRNTAQEQHRPIIEKLGKNGFDIQN